MSDHAQRLTIANLQSGRNGVDPPQALSETQCVEAINVDWYNAPLGRRRNGVSTVSLTNSPFSGTFSSMTRHVPTIDETLAELWATDDAATPNIGRLVAGTAWATPSLKDVPTGNGWDFTYASLNGKLFIAYKSAVDRLHVWDPVSAQVRRVGVAAMGVPSIANTGSGSYAATLRYYRTRATVQIAGITVRRSEASSSASFTPSGSGTAARVTQGSVPNELETHWEVEASLDNATFYRIATVAIGTTTYDDSAVVTSYSSNPLSATAGTYTPPTSYKFIAADQGRLLGFGNWLSTNPQSRVSFSAVLGSSDIGDDERVPLGNFVGLDENDSGFATALIGPVMGAFFAGKYRQFWKLTASGDVTLPYSVMAVSKIVGVLGPQAVKVCEDETGNPSLVWMSHRGPFRYGQFGIGYLGKGVEDKTIGAASGSSLSLAATHIVSHMQWFGDKRQVWCWVAIDGANDPNLLMVYSVGRQPAVYTSDQGIPSGWSLYTGTIATARCAVMFSNTIAAAMSRDLKPYIGSMTAVNTIGKCDTGTQDFGANYQSYVTTRGYSPWGSGYTGTIMGAMLTAVAGSASIQLTTIRDFGIESRPDACSLAASGSETRVQPRFGGGVTASGMETVQFTLGDAAAVNTSWALDDLNVTWKREAPVVA